MTIEQTQNIQNLYEATSTFVRACLVAKLSIDEPGSMSKDYESTLRIIDTLGLEISEDVLNSSYNGITDLVESKYPDLAKKLIEEISEIVTKTVFSENK